MFKKKYIKYNTCSIWKKPFTDTILIMKLLKNSILVRHMHRRQCRTLCKTCLTPRSCNFSINFENYIKSQEYQTFINSVHSNTSSPKNLKKILDLLDKSHTLKRYKALNLNFTEASNIVELLEHLPNKTGVDLLENLLHQKKLNPNFNLLNVTDLGVLFTSLISGSTLYLAYENHVKNNNIPPVPVVQEEKIVNNQKVISYVPLPRPCQLPVEQQGKVIRFLMSYSIIPKINYILPKINIIINIVLLCYIIKIVTSLNVLPSINFN